MGSITFFLKILGAKVHCTGGIRKIRDLKICPKFCSALPEMSLMTSGEEKRLNQSGEMMDRSKLKIA